MVLVYIQHRLHYLHSPREKSLIQPPNFLADGLQHLKYVIMSVNSVPLQSPIFTLFLLMTLENLVMRCLLSGPRRCGRLSLCASWVNCGSFVH